MLTRPAAIKRSAPRRDATPAWARNFASRMVPSLTAGLRCLPDDPFGASALVERSPGAEPQARHLSLSVLRRFPAGAQRARADRARGRRRPPPPRPHTLRAASPGAGPPAQSRRVAGDPAPPAGPPAAIDRSAATLVAMNLELLRERLEERGEPAFRADQVWEWAARGASSYAEMTNLPATLREELEGAVPLSSLTLEREALARDGTEKALFSTADGKPVEAVLMRYRDGRRSLCLSSQSGCPLECTFCATGSMRFGRNLTASEILDQALHFRRTEDVDHVVFMGMGEPMMNLDAVLAACERLPDLGVTHRRTAISTVGWVSGIRRLAASPMPIRLALSLHAPEDG